MKVEMYMGRKGAGKDTIAEQSASELQKQNYSVSNLKLAQPLKDSCLKLFQSVQPDIDIEDREAKEQEFSFRFPVLIQHLLQDCQSILEFTTEAERNQLEDHISELMVSHSHESSAGKNDQLVKFLPDNMVSISPRKYQQMMGTEICRAFDNDIWVNHLLRSVLELHQTEQKDKQERCLQITDVRFSNEAKKISSALKIMGIPFSIKCVFREEHDETGRLKRFAPVLDVHVSEKLAIEMETHILDLRLNNPNIAQKDLSVLVAYTAGIPIDEFEVVNNRTKTVQPTKKLKAKM